MSGLPKRKYRRLDSPPSVETTELPESMPHKEVAKNVVATDHAEYPQADDMTALAMELPGQENNLTTTAEYSADQIFSGNSSFEQESESLEQTTSQFQEMFHRMSSSQSESWFTASSLIDELGANTSSGLAQTESLGAVSLLREQHPTTMTTATTNVNKDTRISLFEDITSTVPLKLDGAKKSCRPIGNEVEIPGPPGRSFVLRPHTSFSVRDTQRRTTTPQMEKAEISLTNSASPTKMLRTKWKRLFGYRSPAPSSTSQLLRSKSHQIQRSLSHHSTIIEVSSEPLSYACLPRNIVLIKEKSNLAGQSILTSGSVHAKSSERQSEDLGVSGDKNVSNRSDSNESRDFDEVKLPKSLLTDNMPQTPVESTKPNLTDTKTSLVSARSMVSMGSRGDFHRHDGTKLNRRSQLIQRQQSDTNDANSIHDPLPNAADADHFEAPAIPDEFKTSFEREQDDPENLLVREAHVGALALAWATGTRKGRHQTEHSHSERQTTSTSPLKIGSGFRLYSQKRKYETEYLESPGDAMRILAKFHKENAKVRTIRSIFKQHSSDKHTEDDHIIGSVAKGPLRTALTPLRIITPETTTVMESEQSHPIGDSVGKNISPTKQETEMLRLSSLDVKLQTSTTGVPQNKLFMNKRTGSKRALNVSHSDDEDEMTSDSPTTELGDDVMPTGQRAQMRRGGQDIPPLCSGGGPLGTSQQPLLQKSQSRGIGWRLSQRKILNEQRRKIADYSFLLAVVGILLMVLELEFLMARVYTRDSFYSLLIKSLISASTFILIALIIFYHAVDIKLFSVNNCIEDWRIATNPRKIGFVVLEVFLCMIHPPPILSNYLWPGEQSHLLDDHLSHPDVTFPPPRHSVSVATTDEKSGKHSVHIPNMHNSSISYMTPMTTQWSVPHTTHSVQEHKSEFISLELSLSIPMFLRLYLIFRVLLLHSTFFTDAGSQSIGALNRVKINVRFVLKTLATAQPGTMLLIFILSMWVITSWIMRVCERQQNPEYERMLNTMWLIAVTFLSIGYGDMVPSTHCGRSISVIAGVMGSACTALVVAVVARKLELTRAEKHVHNFMQDNKVYKQLRHSAANVLRETWLFYKHTRLVKRVNAARVRMHQRKFLQAISRLRKAKDNQRKVKEDANSMVDVVKLQTSIQESVTHIRGDQAIFLQRLLSVEKCINQLQMQISQLPDTLNLVLECGQMARPVLGVDDVDEYTPSGVAFTLDG